MWFVIFLVSLVSCVLLSIRVFNYIQLDGYRPRIGRRLLNYSLTELALSGLGALVYSLVLLLSDGMIDWLGLIIISVPPLALFVTDTFIRHKTPLKITKRVTRLYITYIIVLAALIAVTMMLGEKSGSSVSLLPIIFGVNPLICMLALGIIAPLESRIKRRLIKRAADSIKSREGLIKIGITGSYGKTGVKNILSAMLMKKYNVVASPESYNTPMGAVMTSKLISGDTDVLIMEMGARRPGDIAEMARIIEPDIGILTGIAPQHMATFKTLENVIGAKYELITALPANGAAFFNGNDENVRKLFYRTVLGRKFLTLKSSGYVHASGIVSTIDGVDFVLRIGENAYQAHTKLLGEHNIENILLAANAANYLGVSDEDIVQAIEELDYTPHRMQLIRSNGMFIIDDSYNCNPVGAKRALQTIAGFPNRKIVVTQGIVEGGEIERKENYRLGLMASSVADLVFAVGVNSNAIREGLLDGGYNPTRIISTDSLGEAEKLFPSTLSAGDVVLLMNDLPDNY